DCFFRTQLPSYFMSTSVHRVCYFYSVADGAVEFVFSYLECYLSLPARTFATCRSLFLTFHVASVVLLIAGNHFLVSSSLLIVVLHHYISKDLAVTYMS